MTTAVDVLRYTLLYINSDVVNETINVMSVDDQVKAAEVAELMLIVADIIRRAR